MRGSTDCGTNSGTNISPDHVSRANLVANNGSHDLAANDSSHEYTYSLFASNTGTHLSVRAW